MLPDLPSELLALPSSWVGFLVWLVASIAPAAPPADVAGGRGEVACELLNLHAIPATVLEPRLLQPRQRIDPLATGAEATGAVPRAFQPDHLRLVVTPALTACLTAGSLLAAAPPPVGAPPMPPQWPAAFQQACQQARHRRWASPGSSHEPAAQAQQPVRGRQEPEHASSPSTPSCPAAALAPARVATPPPVDRPAPKQAVAWSIPLDSDTDEDGLCSAAAMPAAQAAGGRQQGQGVREICDPLAAWRRVTECSALVGMHPDQATGEWARGPCGLTEGSPSGADTLWGRPQYDVPACRRFHCGGGRGLQQALCRGAVLRVCRLAGSPVRAGHACAPACRACVWCLVSN